ncbi:NAD(P)/FAD-dependent oxidoreductase [Rhodoflexus caldus]|uniref:NAD(P)/FAD-dependent oxidoreductase n=1 Tax=Rhodoflexus caldus TaxID=2891236 RepID=UPI00202A5122|nr:FAD-dependent oxidoreductase [Rhodoflexus caldus]
MLSFWEKASFTDYDYAVIGGGIVGLSTAAALAESQPDKRILLIERGALPTGASSKNAGFACFGSLTELLADLQTMSEEEMLALVELRWKGLLRLRQRLGDERIGYEPVGGYELIGEQELNSLQHLEAVNFMLFKLFKQKIFTLHNDKIREFGFCHQHSKALVFNCLEGMLHTGQMMKSLWQYAAERGVHIVTGCEVRELHEQQGKIVISCQTLPQSIDFQSEKVAVCTNAFARELFPELDVRPGRGQVLITEPIPNLPFRGAFHMDEGYYYFRNVGNCVLFGGGRNADFAGETTTKFEVTPLIMNLLEEKLRRVILPDTDFRIAMRWAGIMAFGPNKQPIVQPHPTLPQVFLGVRMGGMGVAIGSMIGNSLAELMRA